MGSLKGSRTGVNMLPFYSAKEVRGRKINETLPSLGSQSASTTKAMEKTGISHE